MAGIYIHIPFCRQKCYYCDFYKTVNVSLQQKFLLALKSEAKIRKNYLQNEAVETIYFGGGTPSVLKHQEINDILKFLKEQFCVSKHAELTLEANPDDLTQEYLQAIKETGINRLSIGVQSFNDKYLQKMNRRHNSKEAITVIYNAAKIGFNNISIDLIYGLPNLSNKEWNENLNQAFELPVQHLSAYHLTYHEGTPFYTWLKKGTLKELKEKESIQQFNSLLNAAEKNDYEHYEISNFAKNKLYSKHNTSYWMGEKYLGLGPSAHSFNGNSRCWNMSSVEAYLKRIDTKTSFSKEEILSENDKYNEYILTHIRTKWGVDINYIAKHFGTRKKDYLLKQIAKYKTPETVIIQKEIITLSRQGLFISDEIMADLFII